MTPRFISIEGGEGAGKSTQIRLLAATIERLGGKAVVTREPGGSTGAEEIRALILSGDADRWSPRTEALLFAAARADHVERVIRPSLAAGSWVLCDRYVDSSRAYQGAGLGLEDHDLMAVHEFGSEGLLPDRTLYLRLDMAEAHRRALARDRGDSDRIGGRSLLFHAHVASAFDSFAEREPERFRVVDANGTPEEVETNVRFALMDYLQDDLDLRDHAAA